jgi:hypothetical protein
MLDEGRKIIGQHFAGIGCGAAASLRADDSDATDVEHFVIFETFDISPDSTAVSTMTLPALICRTISEVTMTGALRPNTCAAVIDVRRCDALSKQFALFLDLFGVRALASAV